MQAQDAYAARLAFRARSETLTAIDVDRARTEERSLVRTWVMRQTVHLIDAEDWHWLVPLYEPAMVRRARRRLAHFGMGEPEQERALAEISRLLEDGPRDRTALSDAVERATGIEVTVQLRTALFWLAVASGLAAMGPDIGGRTCLVLERDWLGERRPFDREAALRELALRYLRAFGPASEADFRGWSGLGVRDLRTGLAALGAGLRQDGEMLSLDEPAPEAPAGIVRLLPAFDTYLMGHRDRDFIASAQDWPAIGPGGGILHPVVLRAGRAVATWRTRRRPNRLSIEVEPLASVDTLDGLTEAAIEAERRDIARFEGLPVA